MLRLFTIVVLTFFTVVAAALAQSPAVPAPPAPSATAGTAPEGKKPACQIVSQGFKGQDKRDHMQLCMAQAHLDCLKQAIDQKIVGPQRKDFVKSCLQ